MASQQPVPEWVYVFVNPYNSVAVLNLRNTGQYVSPVAGHLHEPEFARAYSAGEADFLPFVPNSSLSMGSMSPFVVGAISDYRVEYDAELARRAFFKDAPSRLTGIYAFESLEMCHAADAKYRWGMEQVQRFQPVNVLRAVRVNMEIVSLARVAYRRAMMSAEGIEHLWRAYWSGAADCEMELPNVDGTQYERASAGTIWEWIIDGVLLHESRVEQSTGAG